MKVFGFFIVILGIVVAWIGITGSQHRVAAIIKGVHLTGKTGNTNQPVAEGSGSKEQGGASSQQSKTSSYSLA